MILTFGETTNSSAMFPRIMVLVRLFLLESYDLENNNLRHTSKYKSNSLFPLDLSLS